VLRKTASNSRSLLSSQKCPDLPVMLRTRVRCKPSWRGSIGRSTGVVTASTRRFARLASNRRSYFLPSAPLSHTAAFPRIYRMDYIRFYHLRAYDRIHAPYQSLIKKMTDNSGVRFHEAMVALSRQWIGEAVPEEGQKIPTEVTVSLPEPTSAGIVVSNNATEVKKETVRIPATEDEARQIIERFEHGAADFHEEREVADNVAQHMLEDHTALNQEKWMGTEEEELQAYVSELLYIHSKVMIVDDRRVIVSGSLNLRRHSSSDHSSRWDPQISMTARRRETETLRSRLLLKTRIWWRAPWTAGPTWLPVLPRP
jgi:hypothetical protein